jgi:hypothetical protein
MLLFAATTVRHFWRACDPGHRRVCGQAFRSTPRANGQAGTSEIFVNLTTATNATIADA